MRYETGFERISEAQKMSFQRSFLKDPAALSVNPSGDDPTSEMHAKRSELRKLAKGLIEVADKEKRNMSDDEKRAFDACSLLLEDVQHAFDKKQERQHMGELIAASMSGRDISTRGEALEFWTDQDTGRKVPVLGKENRFQDHYRSSQMNDITARDFFAGLSGGNVSAEIRSAMAANSDSKGGFMVPEYIAAQVIDLMRAKNTVINAGAKSIPLPAETVRVCRVVSDPTASWVPENTLIPDTNMEIGALEFHAKKLTTLVKASTELLQDAGNAGQVIMGAIASAMALELDSAALLGDGVGKPLGIFNSQYISTYSLGDNGAILAGYDDLLYGVREIVNANGPIPTTAIMAPRTLVGYSLLKDGEGRPLVKPDIIKNMQFLDTTKIPVDQTQGSSDTCSSIILGGFEQLVIGIRLNMEIRVLQERYADYGQVGFLATMRADTAVYQPKSFCRIIGIKP